MISFVYFDVGGVLEIDFSGNNGWNDLQKALGVTSDKQEAFEKLWAEKERDICTTEDVGSMIPLMNKQLGLSIPQDYNLLEAFVVRYDKNLSIWPIVHKMHQSVKVGLFTMMYPGLLQAIMNAHLIPDEKWDAVVDSSIEGYTKYDDELFHIAEEKTQIRPEEILFVDNSQKHIAHAQRLGWQTFLYDPKNPETSSSELLSFFEKQNSK